MYDDGDGDQGRRQDLDNEATPKESQLLERRRQSDAATIVPLQSKPIK